MRRRSRPDLGGAEELERAGDTCRLPEVASMFRRMAAELRASRQGRRARRIDPHDTPDPFLRP
jgi:hypothetical protein